jgi:hypothetical protein
MIEEKRMLHDEVVEGFGAWQAVVRARPGGYCWR